jgi:hypothetical protein
VQLIELDLEFLDGICGDGQGEGTTVASEELVEGACEAIIIEGGDLFGGKPQALGIVARGPGSDAVEGFAGEQEILEEDHQGLGRGEATPAILRGQIVAEEVFQPQASQQAIEDGEESELVGVEGPSGRSGGVAQERGLERRAWHRWDSY